MYLGPVTRFVGSNIITTGMVHFPYIHITTILVTFCLDTHHLRGFTSIHKLQYRVGDRRNHPVVRICGVGSESWSNENCTLELSDCKNTHVMNAVKYRC